MKSLNRYKCFGGTVEFFEHASPTTQTPMRFSVFLPPQSGKRKVPVLYWLSGLTCTEENFTIKSGAQRYASENGMALVVCDTSPRGANIPGEGGSYDFGLSAGFYLNATEAPWSKHYKMYDYVLLELRELVNQRFPVLADKTGIFGHSMGGHGALVLGLRNPEVYQSISAFAPICAPTQCGWGQKALRGYLGGDQDNWLNYDSTALLPKSSRRDEILVDQGTEDKFLHEHLMPEKLEAAAKAANYPLRLRYQPGYDHSYYFVSTFIGEHIAFHSQRLNS